MTAKDIEPPTSLGLRGDGDEIAAIRDVECRFDVELDYADASNWRTVGDVFQALRKTLPKNEAEDGEIWATFVEAISAETGVDPTKVEAETLLLGSGRFSWRLAIIVAAAVGTVLAIMFNR